MTDRPEHPLPALARHRALRPAVRAPGPDAEHPAPGRPGDAVPRGVLRGADVLGQPRLPAHGAVGAHQRHDRARAPRLDAQRLLHHILHTLRDAGYWSGLIGEQHLSVDPDMLGYDHVVDIDTTHVETVAPAAVELLRERPPQPFFLSVGFFETHREYFPPTSIRDSLYSLPPDNLPDTPETRQDMASYKASARSLDQGVGAVLNALDEHDIADDTLVILTTDHGLAFPGAKATLTDRGIGVLLIMRGPGRLPRRPRVRGAGLADRPLPDDLRAASGSTGPDFLQGRSMLPVMRKETAEVNDAIFAELTYHAAYEPQRAIRTQALEVHPPLRRPRAAGARQHRRRADQGPVHRRGLGRAAAAARGAARPAVRPGRGAQPGRRAGARRRAGRDAGAARGVDARDRRPAARRRRRAAARRGGERPGRAARRPIRTASLR